MVGIGKGVVWQNAPFKFCVFLRIYGIFDFFLSNSILFSAMDHSFVFYAENHRKQIKQLIAKLSNCIAIILFPSF